MEWWRLRVRNRKAASVLKGGVMWLLLAAVFVAMPALVVVVLCFQQIHAYMRRHWHRRLLLSLVATLSLVVMGVCATFLFDLFFVRYLDQELTVAWLVYASSSIAMWVSFEFLTASLAGLLIGIPQRESREWFG